MNSNKKLLKIWDEKENSYENFNKHENLIHKDKMRIFDLLKKRTNKKEEKIKND
jgi:hypothetical protein